MKKVKIFSLIVVVVSLLLYGYSYIKRDNNYYVEKNRIDYSLEKEINYRYVDIKEDDYYMAILSIPQIKLKKGIYDKNDSRNNILENVTIHIKSDYPNEEKSNVILYAHSGSGDKAFFKDLYKLNLDSLVELYYNHTKYIYKIENIYNVVKNGQVKIFRDSNLKTITLITCSQENKDEQIVFIGYLVDEIEY